METIKYIIFGIVMGVSNVIPGVSGGTIAIVLNFYDRLMESVTLNFKVIKKNLPFLIPLAIGMVIGVVGLSFLMKYLLAQFPTQTYSAFIGIILGSIPLIHAKATRREKVKAVDYWPALVAIAIMLVMTFVGGGEKAFIKYNTLTVESFIMCVVSIAIGAATMIIPGVSGSMMLLIMGMYGTIYAKAIGEFYIPFIIPCAIGGIAGFIGGAKLIDYFLKHYEQGTYMLIFGLLIGSVIELVKTSSLIQADALTLASSMVILVIFTAIIYMFSRYDMQKG